MQTQQTTDQVKLPTLHIYPTHFTFNQQPQTYQLNGPLRPFLEAISRQELPENSYLLFSPENYSNGCVKIQIFDHRIRYKCLQKDEEKVYSRIYTLKPTIKTFWNDMKRVVGNAASLDMNKLGKSELEFALDVESEVLKTIQPTLELSPSPDTMYTKNLEAFNEKKYAIKPAVTRKRTLESLLNPTTNDATRLNSKIKLMLSDDPNRSDAAQFHPRFSVHSFIEDWKRKKLAFDEEVISTCDKPKNRTRKFSFSSMNSPNSLMAKSINSIGGKRIVRSMKWESNSSPDDKSKSKTYTTLNIYDSTIQPQHPQFDAILRFGEVEGTSVGKYGCTRYIPLGNKEASELFLASFKSLHQVQNTLVKDSTAPQMTTPQMGSTNVGSPRGIAGMMMSQTQRLQVQQQNIFQQQLIQQQQQSNPVNLHANQQQQLVNIQQQLQNFNAAQKPQQNNYLQNYFYNNNGIGSFPMGKDDD